MNRSKAIICFILTGIFFSKAFAQTSQVLPVGKVHHFTKGLLVNAPARYGREALYTDELAYKLYTKTLRTPVDGENFGKDDKGEAIVWKAVTADSANRLFLRGLPVKLTFFYFIKWCCAVWFAFSRRVQCHCAHFTPIRFNRSHVARRRGQPIPPVLYKTITIYFSCFFIIVFCSPLTHAISNHLTEPD